MPNESVPIIAVSLRPNVRVFAESTESLVIRTAGREMRLTNIEPGQRDLLLRLADGPIRWHLGPAGATEEAGASATESEFADLTRRRLVGLSCSVEERALMTAVPTGGPARFGVGIPRPDCRLKLSRFAYVRSRADRLVVELPHRFLRLEPVAPEALALIAVIAGGASLSGLTAQSPPAVSARAEAIAQFLAICGAIDVAGEDGIFGPDADGMIATREFHDVAFHAMSRSGFADGPVGGAFPFAGSIPPAAAVKSIASDVRIALDDVDISDVISRDRPLGVVMEERRSIRHYGSGVITLKQVSEFLYRVARVRRVIPADPARPTSYETSNRTYPSGGATYDLEIYVTFRDCVGVEPGVYHYDPVSHSLSLVSAGISDVTVLIERARRATGQPRGAPVLVTLASRFSRLSWKYRAIAYATTLKNVGVLYEAMYLAATAMGLAPCALGSGDSAIFSRITGLDPLVESSVGEFVLGLPAEPAVARGVCDRRESLVSQVPA